MSAELPATAPADPAEVPPVLVWRIPAGQRLLFEDFEDGIVMFDARVGSTHLLNVTAAEALAILADEADLTAEAIRARLLDRLAIDEAALPHVAVQQLLDELENLGLVAVDLR